MASVKWCLRQKGGLELAEENQNMAESYTKMAEESINVLSGVKKSRIWTATAAYYIFYYSLYSVMLRIGVKCEIHSCSLEFMKQHLSEFYGKKDAEMIGKAFEARISLQYYADRPVDGTVIAEVSRHCKEFFIRTKDILSNITENQVLQIREALRKEMKDAHGAKSEKAR